MEPSHPDTFSSCFVVYSFRHVFPAYSVSFLPVLFDKPIQKVGDPLPEQPQHIITTIEDLLSDLHERIAAEVESRSDFRARNLAMEMVIALNEEDPHFLASLADRLIENEVMRQVDNVVRDRRTRALSKLRTASATQKKFKLLVQVGEAIANEEDDDARREAVIDAAHNVWQQSVTVAKDRRIRLRACTEEDLQFLADRYSQRSKSFGRNALFYNALRQLVIDSGVNTVGDLPEESLEVAAEKLESDSLHD